jgi:hypothetical protein
MSQLCTIFEDQECLFYKPEDNEQHINLIIEIEKWKEIYINDFFYNLSGDDQISFLLQLKHYFLCIFDCSLGGELFHFKLMKIFARNNYNYNQIMEDIGDRLERILKLIGVKIFEHLKIPLVNYTQLYTLNHDQIIKYLSTIFIKIGDLLDKTIQLFKDFNEICNELNI